MTYNVGRLTCTTMLTLSGVLSQTIFFPHNYTCTPNIPLCCCSPQVLKVTVRGYLLSAITSHEVLYYNIIATAAILWQRSSLSSLVIATGTAVSLICAQTTLQTREIIINVSMFEVVST